MYLINTSIWIDYLSERDNIPVRSFQKILEQKLLFGIAIIICKELLQSAESKCNFNQLEDYFSTQNFFILQMSLQVFHKQQRFIFTADANELLCAVVGIIFLLKLQ